MPTRLRHRVYEALSQLLRLGLELGTRMAGKGGAAQIVSTYNFTRCGLACVKELSSSSSIGQALTPPLPKTKK